MADDGQVAALLELFGIVEAVAAGEEALNSGSSVILENPSAATANATDRELLSYVLGNYKYW